MNSNSALDCLRNIFTSEVQPTFSDNPTGIDKITIHRTAFEKFIKDQNDMFFCTFLNNTTYKTTSSFNLILSPIILTV
jgi:hypothetical protein